MVKGEDPHVLDGFSMIPREPNQTTSAPPPVSATHGHCHGTLGRDSLACEVRALHYSKKKHLVFWTPRQPAVLTLKSWVMAKWNMGKNENASTTACVLFFLSSDSLEGLLGDSLEAEGKSQSTEVRQHTLQLSLISVRAWNPFRSSRFLVQGSVPPTMRLLSKDELCPRRECVTGFW